MDIPVETLLGTLNALEVTIKTHNGYYEKHYYVKGIGLIKSEYGSFYYDDEDDFGVDGKEKLGAPYTIEHLTTLYGFHKEYNGEFYEDLHLFQYDN